MATVSLDGTETSSSRCSSPEPSLVAEYRCLMETRLSILIPRSTFDDPQLADHSDIPAGSSTLRATVKLYDSVSTSPSQSREEQTIGPELQDTEVRMLTKAEKQNAKKKRRKERERAARLEEETSLAKERAEELARGAREEERKRMVTSGSGRFVSSTQR